MIPHYEHLGIFSDWVSISNRAYSASTSGAETQQRIREILNFTLHDEQPQDARIERQWERDGLIGEHVSWSVGYGPRTATWVLRPAGTTQPLPGIVALHDHGAFKFYGKEKIADGSEDAPNGIAAYREHYYGSRAFANALAREGFVVLIHDTFLWGSRRFPIETMPESIRQIAQTWQAWWRQIGEASEEISYYNACASLHEHVIEKYCAVLGTTLAGVVSYEDRVALNYLASRPDVIPQRLGCIGLSGGGCRAALLRATSEQIVATVIVGMMSTYEHLLDHSIVLHTWMFFPPGLAREGDWTDLVTSRAPSRLLVQYDLDDDLFTVDGMHAAHEHIQTRYANINAPENYLGEFYPGPHRFDVPMQESAFQWLKKHL